MAAKKRKMASKSGLEKQWVILIVIAVALAALVGLLFLTGTFVGQAIQFEEPTQAGEAGVFAGADSTLDVGQKATFPVIVNLDNSESQAVSYAYTVTGATLNCAATELETKNVLQEYYNVNNEPALLLVDLDDVIDCNAGTGVVTVEAAWICNEDCDNFLTDNAEVGKVVVQADQVGDAVIDFTSFSAMKTMEDEVVSDVVTSFSDASFTIGDVLVETFQCYGEPTFEMIPVPGGGSVPGPMTIPTVDCLVGQQICDDGVCKPIPDEDTDPDPIYVGGLIDIPILLQNSCIGKQVGDGVITSNDLSNHYLCTEPGMGVYCDANNIGGTQFITVGDVQVDFLCGEVDPVNHKYMWLQCNSDGEMLGTNTWPVIKGVVWDNRLCTKILGAEVWMGCTSLIDGYTAEGKICTNGVWVDEDTTGPLPGTDLPPGEDIDPDQIDTTLPPGNGLPGDSDSTSVCSSFENPVVVVGTDSVCADYGVEHFGGVASFAASNHKCLGVYRNVALMRMVTSNWANGAIGFGYPQSYGTDIGKMTPNIGMKSLCSGYNADAVKWLGTTSAPNVPFAPTDLSEALKCIDWAIANGQAPELADASCPVESLATPGPLPGTDLPPGEDIDVDPIDTTPPGTGDQSTPAVCDGNGPKAKAVVACILHHIKELEKVENDPSNLQYAQAVATGAKEYFKLQ